MSRDYQTRFLREQIAEYDQLLCDNARTGSDGSHRTILKSLEKQKVRREELLKESLAEDKKDRVARSPAPNYPKPPRPGSLAPNLGDHGPSDSALAASSGWRLR